MQKDCSSCGSEFHCGFTDGAVSAPETLSCWCAELPRVSPVPTSDQDCLCPECLGKSIAKLINREAAESR
jgi:hypothetical protein